MTVATVSGIPIRLHWSFLALWAALAAYALSVGGAGALAMSLVLGLGLLGSVCLHELGHAMAAKQYGIDTAHITMYPFGGVAAIKGMPDDPDQELVIALAGPAVNFALVAVFGLLWSIVGGRLVVAMIAVNLMMGLFNLIPAFPMDGGRVLRALLARRMGWVPASMLAIRIGRGFAWAFLGLGLVFFHPGLLMVGAFLHVALNAEKQRLVHLVWERKRSGKDNWTSKTRWGRGFSRLRLR
jgi:Zn-dependent protease